MKTLTARYRGKCANCGTIIDPGETIAWLRRGVVHCADCAEQWTLSTTPDRRTELIHIHDLIKALVESLDNHGG